MRIASRLLMLALLCHQGIAGATPADWKLVRTGSSSEEFVAVAVHPAQPTRVFAATPRVLYESADDGQHWQERFRIPVQATVTGLAVDSSEKPTLLLATDHGLYGSFDGGTHWSRVFRGAGEGENACTYVAFQPHEQGTAFLGTRGGLFVSVTNGRRWKAVTLPHAARHVLHFTFDPHDPNRLYVIAARGFFVGALASGRWEKRVGVFDAEATAVEESQLSETGEGTDSLHHLSAVAADPLHPSTLYLATSRGLEMSTDGGVTWQWLPRRGLISPVLLRLLLRRHSPLVIYAATGHGVARYEPERERWDIITNGRATTHVNDLAATRTQLWAATHHGLYRYQVPAELFDGSPPPSIQELLANFVHEPTVAAVQQAAIRYAEVHPDKIKRWRRQASLKALLPTLSFDFDKDDDRFITSRGSTSNPETDRFLVMDDPSRSFDLSIKWNLGELIWNDDQTSIDVRSKLMVQLRDDIIDEVTRMYFERRRLQVTLFTTPPSDQQALLEHELRLQELTALIDGLTGGFLSKSLDLNDNL